MKKNLAKVIAASVMSAAMLSTTIATIAPVNVSAGVMVGQSTFDEGVGLPWHTCETNPAKQTFEIKDGKYIVHIVEQMGPEGRWDLQLRHRNLKIQAGHTYKISGTIKADQAGYVYSKIGNYKGDLEIWHKIDGQNEWKPVQLVAGQEYHFSDTFTANESLEVAEWAFHYANNQGKYGNPDTGMPNGSTLEFDDLMLECTTCGSAYSEDSCNFDPSDDFGAVTPHTNVRLNQVGYYPNLNKKATYVTDSTSALPFHVLDKDGKSVYDGTTKPIGPDANSGENCHIIDFSEVTETGDGFTIKVDENVEDYVDKAGTHYTMNVSHPFKIGDWVYDGVLRDAMNYYYQNRSGVDIEEQYITSGDKAALAHAGGHVPDDAYVQSKWVKSYAGEFDGDKTYFIDGQGGWYDAGDHGKYVVNGGISVWTLQNMYEYSKATGNDSKWADGNAMTIPQQVKLVGNDSIKYDGTNKPDVLDEARYELEWMFKMIVDSKDPYWGTKCSGMVYHKLHDHKWTGLATTPVDYAKEWKTTRIVKPPSTAATLNLSACAAQAARLWKGLDDKFADECLEVAKKTYTAAKANPAMFAPMDQAIGGGAYGDDYVDDDFYWAACELYSTTGDNTYYTDLMKYKNSDADDKALSLTTNLGGGENNGSFSSFNWGCTAGLGTLSLYLSDKTSAADKATIEGNIVKAADKYVAQEESEGMGIPYKGAKFTDPVNIGNDENGNPIVVEGYEWGSNSFVVNNAIVMAYAYNATGDATYMNGVAEAMDYIFGRNGLAFSYVTGYGTHHLQYPHHRYWSHGVDKAFPMAPAGVMSGGPGAGMQDPYVGGLGYKRGTMASQKCFVDNAEAWSVNEVTINWNAPFAWVISFLEDEAPDAKADPDKLVVTPSNITLAVGDSKELTAKVGGEKVDITSIVADSDAVSVSGSTIKADKASATPVTLTVTAGGKTATVKVNITDSSTTTTPSDKDTDTTTKPTTSDVDPSDKPTVPSGNATMWGDVDLNKKVEIADVVRLNNYLLDHTYDVAPQGLINANCQYDEYLDIADSSKIIDYIANIIEYSQLGKQ